VRSVICIISALALLFFSACEKSGTRKLYVLDGFFRSYFEFKEGSTWQYYLNSDTNVRETVQLSNFVQGIMIWEDMEQEFFTYSLNSSIDSQMIVRTAATPDNTGRWALLYNQNNYRQIAELYYNTNQLSGVQGNNDTVTYLSSFNVSDVVYNDVIKLKSSRNRVVSHLYFAKNVGIIRRDYVDGRIFLLKSYSLK
jgi:hypothetical protein